MMDAKERERLLSKSFIIFKDKLIQSSSEGQELSENELAKILKLSLEAAEYFETHSVSLLSDIQDINIETKNVKLIN